MNIKSQFVRISKISPDGSALHVPGMDFADGKKMLKKRKLKDTKGTYPVRRG